jgi:hypothetical protein
MEGEARDRVRRRGILHFGSGLAAIALLYIIACHPRYQRVERDGGHLWGASICIQAEV